MVLTTTASTNYTDPAVARGRHAVQGARDRCVCRVSPYSAADAATTFSFTNDPVIAGGTIVQATHMTEIRLAVNALRTTAGLGSMSFSAPAPAIGTVVRAATIQELRTGADQARAALALSVMSYTDASPGIIKAVHVQQLRNAVQ